MNTDIVRTTNPFSHVLGTTVNVPASSSGQSTIILSSFATVGDFSVPDGVYRLTTKITRLNTPTTGSSCTTIIDFGYINLRSAVPVVNLNQFLSTTVSPSPYLATANDTNLGNTAQTALRVRLSQPGSIPNKVLYLELMQWQQSLSAPVPLSTLLANTATSTYTTVWYVSEKISD